MASAQVERSAGRTSSTICPAASVELEPPARTWTAGVTARPSAARASTYWLPVSPLAGAA